MSESANHAGAELSLSEGLDRLNKLDEANDEPETSDEMDYGPEQDAQEAEPEPEENDEAEEGEDEFDEIDLDGKTYRVPKELKDAHLRHKDYTQKTMALAEQRKAAEQLAQTAAQEREYYANQVAQIVQQISAGIQQLPTEAELAQLARTDPAAYVQLRAERDLKVQQLHQAQVHQQQIMQRHQEENQRAFNENLLRERDSLMAKLPDWKNEKIAAKEREAISSYLSAEGFSKEDLDGITDHRAILVARKAMLYDQLMAGGKGKQQQTQQAKPKVMPAGTQKQGGQPRASKEVAQRFKSSGSMKDALALLNSIS